MKVVFFDIKPYEKAAFEKKLINTKIKAKFFEEKLNPDTSVLAKGADAVCIFVNDNAHKKTIDKLFESGIKLIALRCAGFNNVDVEYANSKGIKVCRVPAYSPYAVAEHAIALLLTLNRKTHKGYIRTRDFNFSLNGLTGFDLHGKTIGVIGTGKIGQIFIKICEGFGMHVIAYDRYPNDSLKITYVSLEEIYRQSDIISFHCPLTDETFHMFNLGTINKVKKGVIIINTSRGALIDADALIEGIKNHSIGGAGLDVYEEESEYFYKDMSETVISDDKLSRLISMPNVIVTSHQAFLTNEALDNIAETTVNNLLSFRSKKSLENEIK